MELGGTITIDFATFHGLVRGVVRSLVRQGFRRICLLNGHGGNIAPLTVVVSELTVELRVPLVTLCYFEMAPEAMREILEHQTSTLHACESETSMMMATEPGLIQRDRLAEARGPDDDRPEIEAIVGPRIFRWQALNARARNGVIGAGWSCRVDDTNRYAMLSDEQLQRVHAACETFEQALQDEEPIRIEDCIAASEKLRTPLFCELLAIEVERQVSRDRLPHMAEYHARFPERSDGARLHQHDTSRDRVLARRNSSADDGVH